MKPQSPDTSLEAERVQIELLRRASVARRFALARSLTRGAALLAWRAIRRANPSASEEEIDLTFVAVHYGQALAERLRADLARRRGDQS